MASLERRYEVENIRRSLAMLAPGTPAVSREDALHLLDELTDVDGRLRRLQEALRDLADRS